MTRTALYRHYNANSALLYVGITDCLSERDRQHAATASWHKEVVRTETQWCNSREHAAALERVAILHEKPLHNIAHVARLADMIDRVSVVGAANSIRELIQEIDEYCAENGFSPATVCAYAANNARLYDRLVSRADKLDEDAAAIRAFMQANPAKVKGASQ